MGIQRSRMRSNSLAVSQSKLQDEIQFGVARKNSMNLQVRMQSLRAVSGGTHSDDGGPAAAPLPGALAHRERAHQLHAHLQAQWRYEDFSRARISGIPQISE